MSDTTTIFLGATPDQAPNGSTLGSTTFKANLEEERSVTFKAPTYGYGIVPIGAVIAIANTGAWYPPAAGVIQEGFALCNGQAFPAGSHPSLTGNMPNLTDNRFLQGSTLPGSTGGSNSKALSSSELPVHSHSITQTDHSHGASSGTYTHSHSVTMPKRDDVNNKIPIYLNQGGNNGYPPTAPYYNATFGLTPPDPTDDDSRVRLGTEDNTHSHTISTNNASASITINTAGSGTSFDLRPQYYNVTYVMRVK